MKPFFESRQWWKKPRVFITVVVICVLVGSTVSIFAGTVDLVSGPFVWIGCLLALREVWTTRLNWSDTLRLRGFWIGLVLVIAGNILWTLRH